MLQTLERGCHQHRGFKLHASYLTQPLSTDAPSSLLLMCPRRDRYVHRTTMAQIFQNAVSGYSWSSSTLYFNDNTAEPSQPASIELCYRSAGRQYTPAEWEANREIIQQLYVKEKKTSIRSDSTYAIEIRFHRDVSVLS